MVTGQAPVTLELRYTPAKNHKQTKGGTHIYHRRCNSCLRQKHIKNEIGSQPTMCQVHTSAWVSLLAPGKTDNTACHPGKTTTHMLRVVPFTRIRTSDARHLQNRNEEKKRRKKKSEIPKESQQKTRNARQDKTRQKRRQGMEKRGNFVLADPWN